MSDTRFMFRVWLKDQNHMLYEDIRECGRGLNLIVNRFEKDDCVMPFASITDKYKIPIFESDILSTDKNGERGIVVWDDEHLEYAVEGKDKTRIPLNQIAGITMVTGNIFDSEQGFDRIRIKGAQIKDSDIEKIAECIPYGREATIEFSEAFTMDETVPYGYKEGTVARLLYKGYVFEFNIEKNDEDEDGFNMWVVDAISPDGSKRRVTHGLVYGMSEEYENDIPWTTDGIEDEDCLLEFIGEAFSAGIPSDFDRIIERIENSKP